jgi:hypothetical protein
MWAFILWGLNLLLVIILIRKTIEIDNEKATILFISYYGLIFIVNQGLWISFSSSNKQIKADLKKISLTLLALFIPLLIFVIIYEQ